MNRESKIDRCNLPPLLQEYSDYMSIRYSPRTVEDKLRVVLALHEFLVSNLGRSIERLEASDVQRYFAKLTLRKEQGEMRQNSIFIMAANIKIFAKWLRREEIIKPEEYLKIEEDLGDIPNEVGEDKRVALSYDEQQKIFVKMVLPLHKQLVWTGLNHGLRRQEYCHLRVKHLELEMERPRLKIELSKGHNRKTRYIPLSPNQVNQWRKWLRFRASMNLPHDYVFFNPKNPRAGGLNYNGLCSLFRVMTKILGVHLYSHRFRYTYAVTLWKHGVDIFVISKLLGHSNIETTIKYLKVREEEFYKKFEEQSRGLFD
ncbi:MAG: site-specific integrase [Candidatus Bathyarchaeia archaeon]